MSSYRVSTARIRSNPWQTRLSVDEDHIRELAADIHQRGLLQEPLGRIVNGDGRPVQVQLLNPGSDITDYLEAGGWYVQLAFGHSRRLALELIAEEDEAFAIMPVAIRELSDEDMAAAAWAENAQRKDLSPMEEAHAIRRRMKDFGWTQAEVAEHLGLARSTVANKVRLLELPEQIREPLEHGEISERVATALLPLAGLPEAVIKRMEELPSYNSRRLDALLEGAKGGRSSDHVRESVGWSIAAVTEDLEKAGWPLTNRFHFDNMRKERCSDCDLCLRRGTKQLCGDPDCFELKAQAWYDQEMAKATAITDLPAMPRDEWPTKQYSTEKEQQWLRQIVANGCEHLHVCQSRGKVPAGDLFPEAEDLDAKIVCWRANTYHCKCLKALERASEEVQAMMAQEKELKRQYRERLLQPATSALANAIMTQELGAWRLVMGEIRHQMRGKGLDWSLEQIAQKIASSILDNRAPYRDPWKDLAKSAMTFEKLFNAADLTAPWDDETRELSQWKNRVERADDWVFDCRQEQPELPAVRGNLKNLQELENQGEKLRAIFGDEVSLEGGMAKVFKAKAILTQILSVLEDGRLSEEDFELAGLLAWRWSGGSDFGDLVAQASAHVLRYTLAFCDPQGAKRQILEGRLRELQIDHN